MYAPSVAVAVAPHTTSPTSSTTVTSSPGNRNGGQPLPPVGFVASVMYFFQLQRLKAKTAPTHGVRLWNLERLEAMNRRAILWAFPLLTAGLVVGIALQVQRGDSWEGFSSPKVLSTIGLWVVFAILLYLRYAVHARGRQLALWTMVAFALLVIALVFAHPFADGGAT